MKTNDLKELCAKYNLTTDDVFTHKHYQIISRTGIDKIQAKEKIFINYTAVKCEPEYCVVKAHAKKDDASIETFGSAKYGGKEWNKESNKWDEFGNTTTWYVMEMAEKRAMSRAVLKLTGFYELGVFGEDESEDFKRGSNPKTPPVNTPVTPTTQNVGAIPADVLKDLSNHLSEVTTQEHLTELFKQYKTEVAKYPTLKGMFTNKKVALNGN